MGSSKTFKFKFTDIHQYEQWKHALETTILRTDGSKLKLTTASKTQQFWKLPMISKEELLFQVENGDILLFRTKRLDKKVSLIKRLYDHVAIFIRKSNLDLYLFEAPVPTGNKETPVSLTSWQNFVRKNHHLLYQKIVYRKLKGPPRSSEFNSRLADFINTVLGLNCVKSPRKVNAPLESIPSKEIFCAELVGACYKHLGVVHSSLSTTALEAGRL